MLTNMQKRYLKKEAHGLKAIYQIGKDGLSKNLFDGISNALEHHELVKIKLLESCPVNKNEVAIDISANCKCDVIEIIGRTITVFKPSKKNIYQLPR